MHNHGTRAALPLRALLLCLALALAVACMPAAAHASSFSDVRGHWAESDGWIDYASSKGLMTGYSGTSKFGPDDCLTRAQVAMVLYRVAGGKPAGDPGFPDVAKGEWYYDAVSWCKAKGVITGYTDDGTFKPDRPVARAELAVMVYRFAKWYGVDVAASDEAYYATLDTGLLDRPGNAYSYARDALVWTCDKGVLNGKFDTQGYPWIDAQATATRGEAAKIFSVLKRDVIERSGSYTVRFDSNGGSKVASQGVASGNKATRPADPTRAGYTFVNWYSDKALTRVFNFASDVTGNATAYAKWQATTSVHDGEAAVGGDTAQAGEVEPTYDDVAPVVPEAPVGDGEVAGNNGAGEPTGDEGVDEPASDASASGSAGDESEAPAPTYDDVAGTDVGEPATGNAAGDPNETEILPLEELAA